MQRSVSMGLAYAMITGSVILWASANVAVKFALHDLPPFTLGALRFLLTSLVLVSILGWREKGLHLPKRKDWWMLVWLGFVGTFLTNVFFFVGLNYTTASNGSLIMAGSPIVITALSFLVLKEKMHLGQLAGVIASFIGVVVVITNGLGTFSTKPSLNIGDIILIGSPICWGLYVIFSKKILEHMSALALVTYSAIISTVFFIPPMIFEITRSNTIVHFTIPGLLAIGYMGLVAFPLSSFWWNRGLNVMGAGRSGIFMNGIPIVTMLLSVLFLGETITFSHIVGAILVIGGVYLTSLREQIKPKVVE